MHSSNATHHGARASAPALAPRLGIAVLVLAAVWLVAAIARSAPVQQDDGFLPTPWPLIETPTPTPTPTTSPAEHPMPRSSGWLDMLNFYRRTAGVAPVTQVTSWSSGALAHSKYMVRTRRLAHSESKSSSYYTSAGDSAARNGNVVLGQGRFSQRELIESWMTAPFHALLMIDPYLKRTGFGTYRAEVGGTEYTGATLDVMHGLSVPSSGRALTAVWPADGMQVPLDSFDGGEYPDPRSSCPGYKGTVGLPILMIFKADAVVSQSRLVAGSTDGDLAHCVIQASNYRNPSATAQSSVRALLKRLHAVIVLPRAPLKAGTTYVTVVTTANEQLSSRFVVNEIDRPTNPFVAAMSKYQPATPFTVTWGATDTGSGVASYEVRYREAPIDGSFGDWLPLAVPTASQTSVQYQGTPGSTVCFSVRATDNASNVSGWSAQRCTSIPLDDLQTMRAGTWGEQASQDYFMAGASQSTEVGATMTIPAAYGTSLAVLAETSSTGGEIEVKWGSLSPVRISLKGSSGVGVFEVYKRTSAYRGQVTITVIDAGGGPVPVPLLAPKIVTIAGIGVAK